MRAGLIRFALPAVLVAACSKPPAATPAATTAAPVSDITLSDYAIAAPTTMPAGYATFRTHNTGKEGHQAALVKLDSGKTVADFVAALAKPGAPPSWVVFLGGPQNTADVTMKLDVGNYVWYCIIPGADGVPHMMKGMTSPMTVTAATGGATAEPVADIDVTMHDYQWDFSKPLTAGHHVLKVSTAVGQPHEFVLAQMTDGKVPSDMVAWAQKPNGPPPVSSIDGIAVMEGGHDNFVTVDLKPGKYALFCFVPDASDGKDHATHGMVKEITIQ